MIVGKKLKINFKKLDNTRPNIKNSNKAYDM